MVTDRLYRALGTFPTLQSQLRGIVSRLPHRLRTVERLGQRLIVDPSELAGFYLYYEREYDDFIFQFLETIIDGYSVALDIGANIGVYTCYFAARIPHVDAFEPDELLTAWLHKNLSLNGLVNVSVHQACVGLKSGTVRFLPSQQRNRGIGSITTTEVEGIECPCTCLDDFLQQTDCHGPCLVKMDIEGAEWLAVQGAQTVLGRPGTAIDILLEIHPVEMRRFGGSPKKLRTLLIGLGYSPFAVTPKGLLALSSSEDDYRFWWVSHNPI
jgi:FkbM family methyltransferase